MRRNGDRGKKLVINSMTSLISQLVSIICSFVLTRLILSYFGSNVNGLVSSISQFLSFISFLEMGIGAVVKSALYKPLATNDNAEISKIIVSTKRFYRKIAYILIAYTLILFVVFPIISKEQFDYFFTGALVIIIAISLFAQYYFGMPYQLLLNADQKTYIPTIVCCVTLIINTVISIGLIYLGASIHIVKLASSLSYIVRPLFYLIYVRRNYNINESIKFSEEPLKQKWNGLAQHIAYVAVNYTDVVVLTLFSTLANVSIYTVYHNVTIGIQQVVSNISVGISAMLGNVLYSESKTELKKTFKLVEWFFHVITVLFFTITGLMIVPFVRIYTNDVNDVNYILPLFAFLITLAQASYSLRTPYETMVLTANHFKQTQNSAFVEVLINVGVSIVMVFRYGLVGVAIGTFLAMTYRTIYFVVYLNKHILYYKISTFIRLIVVDIIEVGLSFLTCNYVLRLQFSVTSWTDWIMLAITVSIVVVSICFVLNYFLYKEYLSLILNRVFNRFRK